MTRPVAGGIMIAFGLTVAAMAAAAGAPFVSADPRVQGFVAGRPRVLTFKAGFRLRCKGFWVVCSQLLGDYGADLAVRTGGCAVVIRQRYTDQWIQRRLQSP